MYWTMPWVYHNRARDNLVHVFVGFFSLPKGTRPTRIGTHQIRTQRIQRIQEHIQRIQERIQECIQRFVTTYPTHYKNTSNMVQEHIL